jgi:hypothetical protein
MKPYEKNQLHIMGCSKSSQILTGIAILLLFLSLLLIPKKFVSAGSNAQEVQNLLYHSYLPVTIQPDNEYYVSPKGNDTNPGTLLRPWRTIGKAASVVEAGDTVYIRGGMYQEAVDINSSGTSDAQIKILAYPGETPVIDGNNFTIPQDSNAPLLELSGNYIIVSGLEVRYSRYIGVLLSGTHDIADKINSHHNYHGGMNEGGDYSIIQNSVVWSNDMQNYNGINPAGDSTGLTAARSPNYAVLKNNVVFGNWGIGLSTYEANHTIIVNNIVYDNFGTNVYISDATNILFQNNFVYTTGSMLRSEQIGIQMGDETSNPPSSNINIINNIVYNTTRNLYCLRGSSGRMVNVLIANNTFVNSTEESGIEFKVGSYENVRLINNIVLQDGTLPVIIVEHYHPGLTFSSNLWSKPPQLSAAGPGDIIGNPLFAKKGDQYTPDWFKLTALSPAINKALSLPEVNVDYFNINRVAPPDIGAVEFFFPP